jgi:bifunctional non-homologous end joining protein LigD
MPALKSARLRPRVPPYAGEQAPSHSTRTKAAPHTSRIHPGERPRLRLRQPLAPATPPPLRARIITDGTPQRIRFTSADKLLFPEARITKGHVLEYYERISPWLLPYLRNRPVTVERLPDGLVGRNPPHFWQKNTPDYYPSWISRIELPTEAGKPVRYPLVNDLETLLYLVNQGALTFHTYFSTVEDLAKPDSVLFDLDRGRAEMADMVAVAKALHRRIEACDVGCTLKTSGKTGLHLVAPWVKGPYDQARAWALSIARTVAADFPAVATTNRQKHKRGRRVYIDVMQNALGHHAVPPYVIRATPRATVSTPLDWDELTPRLDPRRFTIKTIFARLKR